MRILQRYTLSIYLPSLTWCLGVFLGMYLVLDLLGHLDEIIRHKVPAALVATYYGTTVPLVFVQVAPFACLMATLYALGNLNRHQEVMAMRASGVGPWRIAAPFLWVGILMSLMVGVVNENMVPGSALTSQSIKSSYLERPPDPKAPHRVLNNIYHLAAYGMGVSLLYAKTFDPVAKTMEGVVILQQGSDLQLKRKITAESAVWTGSQWRFLNGTILSFNLEGETVGRPVSFGSKIIPAGDRPEILEKAEAQAMFMNTKDLYRYIQHLQAAGGSTLRKLLVELYAKPVAALACLILTLIAIPFAIQPPRGGTALGLSLGVAVGLAFYGINALSLALGKGGWLPPWAAAWATPLGFVYFGVRRTWERLA